MNHISISRTGFCRWLYGLLLALPLTAAAQAVPAGLEVFEFTKISETYRLHPHLSCTATYYHADSAHPNTIVDTTVRNWQFSNGRYRRWGNNGKEQLNGGNYCVNVNFNDSLFTVAPRNKYSRVLELPFHDSLFYATYTQSITVTALNDSTRRITVGFIPQSVYQNYQIDYNRRNYTIRRISYRFRGQPNTNVPGSTGVVNVTVVFSGYSAASLSYMLFDEMKYIRKQNGEIQVQPAYAGYRVFSVAQIQ